MVVLITIFAHNLILTHSFAKQRIDSVRRSISCSSAGRRRHVWTLCFGCNRIPSDPFVCEDIREMFGCRYSQVCVTIRSAGRCLQPVVALGAAPKPNAPDVCLRRLLGPCQTAAGALRSSPGTSRVGGRKGRDGQTADVCCALQSEQSKRKWIYKHSLWGINIAFAAEARCQASRKHALLLFDICVGLGACWPWCPPSALTDQWSQSRAVSAPPLSAEILQ